MKLIKSKVLLGFLLAVLLLVVWIWTETAQPKIAYAQDETPSAKDTTLGPRCGMQMCIMRLVCDPITGVCTRTTEIVTVGCVFLPIVAK